MLENKKLNLVIIGNGKYIINQYPLKNNIVLESGKLFLVTNGLEITMPDMTGWSLNDVETFCSLANLKLQHSGYGYVVTQDIAAGTILDVNNMLLTVQLN